MGNKAKIINNKKKCRLCLQWVDVTLFGTFKDNKTEKIYLNSRCKKCASEVASKWQQKNRPRIYKRWLKDKENLLRQIREAYGNKCNCCGETNPLFLTIDHINNDGYKIRPRNRKGDYQQEFSGTYYKQIVRANFPDSLQLLCWNCNCGKARNKGICPHKT